MKSEIFNSAIINRNRIQFLYDLKELTLDPYLVARNQFGKKVVYGRVNNSNIIKMFEYDKILNIKILSHLRFSPIIPIMPSLN